MSYLAGKWKDLIIPGAALGAGGAAPALTVLQGNAQVYGFATSEFVYGQFEIQHDYQEGTDITVHVHWAPSSTNAGNVVWDFEYTVANVNGVFPATQTLSVTQAGAGVASTHQLASMSAVLPGTGRKIGDIIAFRLLRNATGNTFTGTALLLSIGAHYQCDSLGSNQIASKN